MIYSDWIIIFTTLFLGACALFVPYLAELIKRKLFRPQIRVNFENAPPFSHKTTHKPKGVTEPAPVYYFRLQIENFGKATARQLEVTLENVWIFNSADKPVQLKNFSPVNLIWSIGNSNGYINLNPQRKQYVDIGHIWKKEFENQYEDTIIDLPEYEGDESRFFFELIRAYRVQPNCLPPGKYKFEIKVYSENIEPIIKRFDLAWSGEWKDNELNMFKEICIEKE